jgi:hypothetical protein
MFDSEGPKDAIAFNPKAVVAWALDDDIDSARV